MDHKYEIKTSLIRSSITFYSKEHISSKVFRSDFIKHKRLPTNKNKNYILNMDEM